MLVVYQKYYTPLDRFINKFRRKGFWLYTGLITISLLYMFYEISHLPDIPPPELPPPESPPARRRSKIKPNWLLLLSCAHFFVKTNWNCFIVNFQRHEISWVQFGILITIMSMVCWLFQFTNVFGAILWIGHISLVYWC